MTKDQISTEELKREARKLSIPHRARPMGIYCVSSRGTGKSTLLHRIAWQDYVSHVPTVIFDPVGQTIDMFLMTTIRFLKQVPKRLHNQFWERIVYVDMAGTDDGFIWGWPLYFRLGKESLRHIADRWLHTLAISQPALLDAPVHGFSPLRKVGSHAGVLLCALNLQITSAADLLRQPAAYLSRLDAGRAASHEVAEAVSFFTNEYIPMRQTGRERLTNSFLDRVFDFNLDPRLAAMVSQPLPSIRWDAVESKQQIVLLDYRRVTDRDLQRFLLLWVFTYLYEWIKHRGRRDTPLSILYDEIAFITQQVTTSKNPLAVELDDFINVWMRNANIWFSCAHQELFQLDGHLRNTLLSLGTYIIGRQSNPEACRMLADYLFQPDVFRVKYSHRAWAHEPVINSYTGRTIGTNHFVIDQRPEFMPLDQQQEEAAQKIRNLGRYQFLLRPAIAEGQVGSEVIPLRIAAETSFPDQELLPKVRSSLARMSGKPMPKEQESRPEPLLAAAAAPLRRRREATPLPPGKDVAQESRSAGQEPIQRPPTKTTPPPPDKATGSQTPTPQLDEEQQVFLRFIIDHQPDTPVARVYKGLGLSVRRGTQLRDRLREYGFITFLPGRSRKGRKTSVLLPTLKAYALLGAEPPTGRGGSIHRHIQQLVVQGAEDKGYKTQVEQDLGNGGICDVRLEKGDYRIAVEIAVYSTVERELAHIRHALSAGYDTVYGVFLDEHLLELAQAALTQRFSLAEARKVQLVPVSRLSYLGE
jgi:hypothetical protein